MAFITGDIKHILSISLKKRYDDLSDQYNRLFMIKILIISSLIIGFDYFNDTVSCIIPRDTRLTAGFVSSTCWIQGFYVYDEMSEDLSRSGYYGIPKDLKKDGLRANYGGNGHELCQVGRSNKCKPMTRAFYLQYQYMTFYTAALTILFYFPYIIFVYTNSDVIWLRKYLGGEKADADFIVKNFFKNTKVKRNRLRLRMLMNFVVKLLYIAVNLLTFLFTDFVLSYKYKTYGLQWITWANKSLLKSKQDLHHLEKPGNWLLPSMGICEIHEATEDASTSFVNKSRLICELSPHILYQYCFLVLWFVMIFGIFLSTLGMISLLTGYMSTYITFRKALHSKTLREMEYLEYIRNKNDELYREVLDKLNPGRREKLLGNIEDGLHVLLDKL